MASSSSCRILVVGSGAVGLRTAAELLQHRIPVVLRAPYHPTDTRTCSMGAGGLWMPFHCGSNETLTNKWATLTLNELVPMAQDATNKYVEIVPTVIYQKKEPQQPQHLPEWTQDKRLHFQQLTIQELYGQNTSPDRLLRLPPEEEIRQAGYQHVHYFEPPIVDAPNMLQKMLQEMRQHSLADVDVETGTLYDSIDQMRADARKWNCQIIVNCTGLGAQKLLQDDSKEEEKKRTDHINSTSDNGVVGARGILIHYNRQDCRRREHEQVGTPTTTRHDNTLINDAVIMTEDQPYGSSNYPCYLIPRGDRILIGGSYLEQKEAKTIDNTNRSHSNNSSSSSSMNEIERQQLILNAHRLGIDTDRVGSPVYEWEGLRPVRHVGVRCEFDNDNDNHDVASADASPLEHNNDNIPVIHNYGHGGSGWTLNVGTAKEVLHLIQKKMKKTSVTLK